MPEPHAAPADRAADPRTLGPAWEGVVRSHGLTESSSMAVARRFLEAWQAAGGPRLEIEATRVLIDGQPILEAGESQGAWILPAFTTGIRCFRPLPDAQAGQIRAFGDELARLRPSVTAITRFRDWLWADGAEGMDIEVRASFLEAGETEGMAEAERWVIQHPRRAELANRSRRGVLLSVDDLAALGPTATASRQAAAPRPEQEGWRRLGAACDDGATWGRAIVTALHGAPELRALLPPARLAQFLRQLLTASPDVDLVGQLLALSGDEAGFGTVVDVPDLGVSLARQIPGTPEGLQAIVRLGRLAPLGLLGGITRGLRERAGSGGRAWVVEAVRGIGPERVCTHAQLEGLAASEILTWGEILAGAGALPEAFAPVLKALSPPDALRLAATFDAPVVGALAEALRPALARSPPEVAVPVVFKLCAAGGLPAATVAGDTLVQTRGVGWPPQLLTAVGASLGQHHLQAPLATLTRDAHTDVKVRIRILNLLTDPDAVAAASASSLWDYLEPAELKAARAALRKRGQA